MNRLTSMFRFTFEEVVHSLLSVWHHVVVGPFPQRPPILVNGSPKTGTTWMVRLVASLPGYRRVGNFRGEIQRYASVGGGEVVHGHDRFSQELAEQLDPAGIKVVLTLRDPRDQTVSRMFHILRDPSHGWHERLKRLDPDTALMACLEGREGLPGADSMIRITRSWEDAGRRAIRVRYEDLIADTQAELQKVLQFVGLEVPPALLHSVVRRNRFQRLTIGRRFWRSGRKPGEEDPGSHFRKGIVGDWRNHFKPDHVHQCKKLIGADLVEYGYERNGSWNAAKAGRGGP